MGHPARPLPGTAEPNLPPERWRGGEISGFHRHDFDDWRRGHWAHDRHHGRLGWWWIVGGVWFPFLGPIYPYPNPYIPGDIVEPEAQPPVWYYCQSLDAYYPYVTSCPEGWVEVEATPDEVPPEPW